MDLIYGTDTDNGSKRRKIADNGLPLHLPNAIPQQHSEAQSVPSSSLPSTTATSNDATDIDEETRLREKLLISKEEKKTAPIPIPGTNLTLETKEDLDAWIRERKLNWMKKISNKRVMIEEEEKPQDNDGDDKKSHQRNDRNNRQNNRGQQNRNKNNQQSVQGTRGGRNNNNNNNHNGRSDKFNLNKTLIQRELMDNENKQILEFIRELFDKKIIQEQ